ncbi:MAG: hypothetical protein H0X37_08785 [Herpetosiphonaceae bacterium]|nr:hypothetical protein [Herpetosiphonaceae bacterium]
MNLTPKDACTGDVALAAGGTGGDGSAPFAERPAPKMMALRSEGVKNGVIFS